MKRCVKAAIPTNYNCLGYTFVIKRAAAFCNLMPLMVVTVHILCRNLQCMPGLASGVQILWMLCIIPER